MAAEENRLAHLRALVEAEAQAAGGNLRAGYRAIATATGLKEEYIYQLYKGIKPTVGKGAAVAISRAYANGRDDGWMDLPPGGAVALEGDVRLPYYEAGGSMGKGLILQGDQPGIIRNMSVTREWAQKNLKSHSGLANLCLVTGFGDSMKPMFNPGDPLIVDVGVKSCEVDAVYFFRVDNDGFIKRLQRVPGEGIWAISANKDYKDWLIKKDADFEVFGRVIKAWKGDDL